MKNKHLAVAFSLSVTLLSHVALGMDQQLGDAKPIHETEATNGITAPNALDPIEQAREREKIRTILVMRDRRLSRPEEDLLTTLHCASALHAATQIVAQPDAQENRDSFKEHLARLTKLSAILATDKIELNNHFTYSEASTFNDDNFLHALLLLEGDRDVVKRRLLNYATAHGQLTAMKTLLDHHFDAKKDCQDGEAIGNALHYAARHGLLSPAKLISAKIAGVDLVDIGWAIHDALLYNHLDVAALLFARLPDIEISTRTENNALEVIIQMAGEEFTGSVDMHPSAPRYTGNLRGLLKEKQQEALQQQ